LFCFSFLASQNVAKKEKNRMAKMQHSKCRGMKLPNIKSDNGRKTFEDLSIKMRIMGIKSAERVVVPFYNIRME